MIILGIESSCDETAAAIVRDGSTLLSNVVHSQIDIHASYGGVIPEIAARNHIEIVNPVVNQALSDASLGWSDIDAIAVTYAPGLIGSLLVGTLVARTLAVIHNKPLYPVHHVEGHVYANFITGTNFPSEMIFPSKAPEMPILALIVSGGHSQLVLFKKHGDYDLLGQTRDDAVGEAFDKVAKILGLPYPGGPSIANAALKGDPSKYRLPKAKLDTAYDFSFSGLKTAVLRAVQSEVGVDTTFPSTGLAALLNDTQKQDFAASFQKTAIETLVDKTEKAFKDFSPKSVIIAGGVAANAELRQQLSARLPLNIEYAPMPLCTDNAAMIASLGYYYTLGKDPVNPLEMEVIPSLSMDQTKWSF